MSGKLTVLVGLARSGKSTYCKKMMEKPLLEYDLPRVVVNSDNIRLKMHGQRYYRDAEPLVHAFTKLMTNVLYMQGMEVIIDETNTTISSIRQWLQIDPDAEFIYLDTSPEVCKERAVLTNQSDLIPVIDKMYQNLINLSNYYWHGCVGTNHPNKENIFKSIEAIRTEIKNESQS